MELEFPFGIFRPEKQDYLFRCSVVPGNFPSERLEKPCSIYFPAEFSGKRFVNGKQPVIPVRNKKTPKDSVASHLFKTSFTDLIGTLWVAKDSCSRNKSRHRAIGLYWTSFKSHLRTEIFHKHLIKVCVDCRGKTSIFSSKPANDIKVLVKFFHLRKLMIQSNPARALRRAAFKSDTSLTRTVCFASWEKSLYIFSKFSLLITDTQLIWTLSMAPSISVLKEFDFIENCFAFLVLGRMCYAHRTPLVTIYVKLIIWKYVFFNM